MNHGRRVVPFSDLRSVAYKTERGHTKQYIFTLLPQLSFHEFESVLVGDFNCLSIYYHLQPPKTKSRNLREVNRSTKGYHLVWRRHIGHRHGNRKAMGNIWSLIWLSPAKHFSSLLNLKTIVKILVVTYWLFKT